MVDDTLTARIETDDGRDTVEVPAALVDMLKEGEEATSEVLGNLVQVGLAQQAHAAVHHAEGEPDEVLVDAEALMMELFEDRFGQTFGEMTGHSH
jgi:hypothetical protein